MLQIELTFRDLQEADLELLDWSGGEAHLRALSDALRMAWAGKAELVVGELPNGALIACGAVDYRKDPAELWMLSVHPAWQSLGVGTAMIDDLELRIAATGRTVAALGVEHDNPRAFALYSRLGYVAQGSMVESWPVDSGAIYVTVSTHMVKQLV